MKNTEQQWKRELRKYKMGYEDGKRETAFKILREIKKIIEKWED